MRYELINTSISPESTLYDVENIPEKKDKDGNVIQEASVKETPTDKYFCSISLTIKDTETKADDPTFTKSFTSISDNAQTGFEVDAQRQKEIDEYIKSINL